MCKFKVGDKVYFPSESNKVLTVHENYDDDPDYLIKVDGFLLNTDGRYTDRNPVPSLIHATPENHKLLEQLYGVEFENPPVKPTSREIIQAMLELGDKLVPCMAADYDSDDWSFVLIESVWDDGGYTDGAGTLWDCAKPIDPRTGTEITELPT